MPMARRTETKIGKLDDVIEDDFDPDGWNDYEIIAQGNHLTHNVNGKLFMECIDNQESQTGHVGHLGRAGPRPAG